MEIVEKIVTENPCYKAGQKIVVEGLMLHSVGCPRTSAEEFIKRWNNPDEKRVCVHAIIDGNTGRVFQTLPWNHRGRHSGGRANNKYIGVEMCEPSSIRYIGGFAFQYSDRQACMEVVKRTYDAAVELFAFLCLKFQLDPMGDGVIISHHEGHTRGIADGYPVPEHLWEGLQSGYTMDGFRKDVAMRIEQAESMPIVVLKPTQSTNELKIEKNDVSKQICDASLKDAATRPVSDKAVELVAKYEGCQLQAYKSSEGVWIIGYGHTMGVHMGQKLSSIDEAKKLLKSDLQRCADYVSDCVERGIIQFPLNQNQFDALTCFCYNCGKESLRRLVSGRDMTTVADKMLVT